MVVISLPCVSNIFGSSGGTGIHGWQFYIVYSLCVLYCQMVLTVLYYIVTQ